MGRYKGYYGKVYYRVTSPSPLPPPSLFCNRDIQSWSTLRRIMRRVYSSVPSFSSVQRWISMGLFAVGTNQQRRNFTGGRVFPRVPVVASSTGVPIRVGVIPSFCILNHNTSTIKYGDKGKVWWMSLKINIKLIYSFLNHFFFFNLGIWNLEKGDFPKSQSILLILFFFLLNFYN